MELRELAARIGARMIGGNDRPIITIKRVYAGDRISDMLAQESEGTLVVTNLVGTPLLKAAELMDLPAICLVNGTTRAPDMEQAAERHGIVLLISPFDMFGTCGRLFLAMGGDGRA